MSQHFLWDFWGERMLRQDNDSVCLRCHETLVVLVTSHFTDGVILVGNSISLMGQSDRRIQGVYNESKREMKIYISDVESCKGKLWVAAPSSLMSTSENSC